MPGVQLLAVAAVLTARAVCSHVPHNQREKLLPPEGSGWRGVVNPEGVVNFTSKYGKPLHIYRVFTLDRLASGELDGFIRGGGIVWLNYVTPHWKLWSTSSPEVDLKISELAGNISKHAPAKLYFCPFHEPDHNIDPERGRSPEDYRNMWAYVQKQFREVHGVTNAVYVMDYSIQVGRKTGANVAPLWPGVDRVDWLFFNIFEKTSSRRTGIDYNDLVAPIYNGFIKNSSLDCPSGGKCNFTDLPWGLGAFGCFQSANVTNRKKFFVEAKAGLSKFPKFKAYLYFDTHTDFITEDVMPEFMDFITDPFFTKNDLMDANLTRNESATPLAVTSGAADDNMEALLV